MRGPELAAAMQGSIDWIDGPHVRLGISMAKSPASGVLALWPNAFGATARGWIADHIQGGTLESMRMAVDLDDVDLRMMRAQLAPMDDRILIDYTIKDAAFTFLDGAPAVTGVSGHGRTTGRSTLFTGERRAMESAPGRRLDLSDGQFSMPNFAARPMPMNVAARVRGPVDVLGEILSRPGLEKIASVPLDPKTIKGQFDGTFAYRKRLGPGANPSEGALDVACKIENFSAERLVGKEKFDQGNLTVTVADGAAKITGTGKLFGVQCDARPRAKRRRAGAGLDQLRHGRGGAGQGGPEPRQCVHRPDGGQDRGGGRRGAPAGPGGDRPRQGRAELSRARPLQAGGPPGQGQFSLSRRGARGGARPDRVRGRRRLGARRRAIGAGGRSGLGQVHPAQAFARRFPATRRQQGRGDAEDRRQGRVARRPSVPEEFYAHDGSG